MYKGYPRKLLELLAKMGVNYIEKKKQQIHYLYKRDLLPITRFVRSISVLVSSVMTITLRISSCTSRSIGNVNCDSHLSTTKNLVSINWQKYRI